MFDALVVGGGQAGLAAGYHLKRKGLTFRILDTNSQLGGSWQHYYDSLKLFSPARFSSLPEMRFPGSREYYPSKSEVIQYLRDYALRFQFPVELNSRVTRVICGGDGAFVTQTQQGHVFGSRSVITASGPFHKPYILEMEGMSEYRGTILHSFHYTNAKPFEGKRILVVGAGNSAAQIATELSQVTRTTLATRSPIKFTRQRLLGKDLHFWIRVSGFDTLPLGYWNKVPDLNYVIDAGRYKVAVRSGAPDQRPMFTAFTKEGVRWADGQTEVVDAVIFATGYRPCYPYLADLGALRQDGYPRQRGGVSTAVEGLYHVGLPGQRSFASASLRGVGNDAKYVARRLERYLKAR